MLIFATNLFSCNIILPGKPACCPKPSTSWKANAFSAQLNNFSYYFTAPTPFLKKNMGLSFQTFHGNPCEVDEVINGGQKKKRKEGKKKKDCGGEGGPPPTPIKLQYSTGSHWSHHMALTVTDCTLFKMHMHRKIFMLLHLLYDVTLVQPLITAFGSASKNEDTCCW